jgi:hypothetical protein
MDINGYSVGGYWCLLIVIILMVIGGYSISGYWCLLIGIILVAIILMAIGGYWGLFCCKPLVVFDGDFINDY